MALAALLENTRDAMLIPLTVYNGFAEKEQWVSPLKSLRMKNMNFTKLLPIVIDSHKFERTK